MAELSARDKLVLAGLFLSKFDVRGLEALGFATFSEAFNAIALSLNGNPAALKNYRDEFDPHFSNRRKGWHKRATRLYCRRVMEKYGNLGLDKFARLLRAEISAAGEIEAIEEEFDTSGSNSFAKRLITGQAAEKYFETVHQSVPAFEGHQLLNTTRFGCGFDYKMSKGDRPFLAVEVKGIVSSRGSIVLTSKEHAAARFLRDRYFLFVVRDFADNPFHTVVPNPLDSCLTFERRESTISQISWLTCIGN